MNFSVVIPKSFETINLIHHTNISHNKILSTVKTLIFSHIITLKVEGA